MELGPIFRALMHNPTRFWLITVEVALTLAIVVNCVAIILDRRELLTRPSGLDEPNLVVVTTQPFVDDFSDEGFIDTVRDEDLRRLRAVPGVRAAAAMDYLPLAGGGSITSLAAADDSSDSDGHPAPYFVVGLGAIDTLGVELVAGRDHIEADLRPGNDEPENLIVTQALADRIYPDGDALGKSLVDTDTDEVFGHIVGIIREMHNAWPRSSIAGLAMLRPGPAQDPREIRYMVRTEPGALDAVFNQLEPTVLAVNADRIVTVRSIEDYKRRYFRRRARVGQGADRARGFVDRRDLARNHRSDIVLGHPTDARDRNPSRTRCNPERGFAVFRHRDLGDHRNRTRPRGSIDLRPQLRPRAPRRRAVDQLAVDRERHRLAVGDRAGIRAGAGVPGDPGAAGGDDTDRLMRGNAITRVADRATLITMVPP